ncbi:MAG: hypothetical protein DRP96_06615, partial [Candidatus Neomarinimicrobiota bacterium]
MILKKTWVLIYVLIFTQAVLKGGGAVRALPELAEWSATGVTFYVARRLDHQPARNSRTIFNQPIDKPFRENTVSRSQLYAAAGVTALGIGLIPNSDGWLRESAYRHTKGFVETLSATYLLTVLTKNIVGRQRPCFSNYPEAERLDANKSFPSGHTSIAFALAGYSSLYVLDHFGGAQTLQWIYVAGSHGLAAYVGYTRIIDNRHFLSDVIAGG